MSPHPPASYIWLASRSPIPLVDRGEQRLPPWLLAVRKTARGIAGPQTITATPWRASLKGCSEWPRPCQRSIRGAASAQKKPPPATPKPLERTLRKREQSVDSQLSHSDRTRSTSKQDDPYTASRLLTSHGKRRDRVSNKTTHESQSTKSGLKHSPGFRSLRLGGQGGL